MSASGSDFNPQNTQCIPAVKIFAFLDLAKNFAFSDSLLDMPATHHFIASEAKQSPTPWNPSEIALICPQWA